MQQRFVRKNVRVEVETDKHARDFGLWGIVTKVDEKSKTVTILTDKVGIEVPIHAVEVRSERECQVRQFISFKYMSEQKKTLMLHELGYWDPEAAPLIHPVTASGPARLEDQHLRLFNMALRAKFPQA